MVSYNSNNNESAAPSSIVMGKAVAIIMNSPTEDDVQKSFIVETQIFLPASSQRTTT